MESSADMMVGPWLGEGQVNNDASEDLGPL